MAPEAPEGSPEAGNMALRSFDQQPLASGPLLHYGALGSMAWAPRPMATSNEGGLNSL